MLFSSLSFIYYFLPAILLVYFAVPKTWRNAVLLLFSLLFYFCGEPVYIILLIFSSLADYLHALIIEKYRGTSKAKIALISSIIVNIGMLAFFKYADFFIANINLITGLAIPQLNIPLPVGISFFTFQTMSYTIDVYRGDVCAERNPLTMATYVCLFPQLVAGPIVRYKTVADELACRKVTADAVANGAMRFCVGLGKKVLLANTLGELAVNLASAERSVLACWLIAISYTLQIYFDFSGYSDMAIGLGAIFGFTFPENFNYPFISASITEFWRRWHMTLGSWFRDYLYIPLGGNRVSRLKWVRNIAIVWLATGFWHGAAWNFVTWGAFFGILLACEKLIWGKFIDKHKIFGHIYTILTVLVSFVIFNADSPYGVIGSLGGLVGIGTSSVADTLSIYYFKSYAILLAVGIIGSTPLPKLIWTKLRESSVKYKTASVLTSFAQPLYAAVMLIVSTGFIIDSSFNPFLYFRF